MIDLLERLFPLDGYPGVSLPDPTPEEARGMRRRLDGRLAEVIPRESPSRVLVLTNRSDGSEYLLPFRRGG